MILFTPPSAYYILLGLKTQTRRLWLNARVKVGREYWAQTRMIDKKSRFARLRIEDVWTWDGQTISHEDALAEGFGYENPVEHGFTSAEQEYLYHYKSLNAHNWDDTRRTHYAVKFEVLNVYQPEPPILFRGQKWMTHELSDKPVAKFAT